MDIDSGDVVTVKIAVISSVSAFLVASILFFTVGFLCGHFCRMKRESHPTVAVDQDTSHYDKKQELELNENVAYVPVVLI
jgi:hypothetical protein